MGFKDWLESGFNDYITEKQPLGWHPDSDYENVWVEKDVQVHTPKGPQHLFIIYALVEYQAPHKDTSKEIQPVEILRVFPIAQFDENYIKAPSLYGPPHGTDSKSAMEWGWREFRSNHNHFHLLPKNIQGQIEQVCEEKAYDHLETLSPHEWEP